MIRKHMENSKYVRLDRENHKKVKLIAAERETTICSVINEIVEQYES